MWRRSQETIRYQSSPGAKPQEGGGIARAGIARSEGMPLVYQCRARIAKVPEGTVMVAGGDFVGLFLCAIRTG